MWGMVTPAFHSDPSSHARLRSLGAIRAPFGQLARDLNEAPVKLTLTAVTQTATSASLAPLLAGYLSGDVSDDAMCRFDDLFEDSAATALERAAFARFYLDALATGEHADALPHPSEVSGILAAARA